MPSGYLILTETFWSGAGMGIKMIIITQARRRILMDRLLNIDPEFFGVVPGTILPAVVVRQTGIMATLAAGAVTTDFESSEFRNRFPTPIYLHPNQVK